MEFSWQSQDPDGGTPVARLVPADELGESPIGFMRGTVLAQDDIVSPDPEAWATDDGL